jgi:hypothetical protein
MKRIPSYLIVFLCATISYAEWVLPVADGDGRSPSQPSIQGYILKCSSDSVTIDPDRKDGIKTLPVSVKFIPNTNFFTAFGGFYTSGELQPGQYLWVWYITENTKKAGMPPRAAVIMLWSRDPNDKPSEEDKWRWDS